MFKFLAIERLAPLFLPRETALLVVRQFVVQAKQDAAKYVEAEHMLLTLAANDESDACILLRESGLTYRELASALHEERRRTLAFAGVEPLDEKQTAATELDRQLTLGTSAKVAIKRALIASRGGRSRRPCIQSTELLFGILQAELGTVPRTLAIAGVDRAALIVRTTNPMSKTTC
ncbi:MAG TPA: Clp protease N-terminal domain-containing protein [Candidatus Acidoferrum sp.]|jgi:ATP-dependent Clp protease ATP-binding subunit ClpA|nr:Clp protease N-terminal domain-containing protein [Candidatus Acidoferrum sp.]